MNIFWNLNTKLKQLQNKQNLIKEKTFIPIIMKQDKNILSSVSDTCIIKMIKQ